tara:strand:+ start:57 stop:266 length:210 start_codon:yes stop_codon:yes gene_type:complete
MTAVSKLALKLLKSKLDKRMKNWFSGNVDDSPTEIKKEFEKYLKLRSKQVKTKKDKPKYSKGGKVKKKI